MEGQKADLVLLSENVFTAGPQGMIAGGIAIADNKILFVGTRDEILRHADKNTDVRDYGAQLITPGICDSHIHLLAGSYLMQAPYVGGHSSALACAEALAAYFHEHESDYGSDEWLCATGFAVSEWDDPKPPAKDVLDRFFPARAVFIYDSDLHAAWVNSKALEQAGVDASTPEPRFGKIIRDEEDTPTGYLVEEALNYVVPLAFTLPEKKERSLIEAHNDAFAAFGITSVVDMRPLDNFNMGNLAVIERMADEGVLKFRYNYTSRMCDKLETALEHKESFGNPWARIYYTGIKEFIDGIVTAHTGLMLAPYADDAQACYSFWATDLRYDAQRVKDYQKNGINLQFHAVGDGAVRKAVDMYEDALKENGPTDARLSIEHLDLSSPDDWPRIGQAGIVCSVQPQHLTLTNSLEDDLYVPTIGTERAKGLWAFKSMLGSGAVLAFGTDFPVVSYDPRISLHRAITRRFPDGKPACGWNPEQKLTLWDALIAYTWGGAYKTGKENALGSLEEGKLADIVVWESNLFDIPEDDILDESVALTVFDGAIVYER